MARFTEQSNIRRVNTETGHIAQTNSLLNRLTAFTDSAANLIQKEQVKSSVEEAKQVPLEKKDGLTQAPKTKKKGFKERFITGGISVDAYNKTLETAYLAGLSNDTKNAIAKIELENPDDTVAFNTQAQGYIKGLVENVDPAVQNQVAQFAQNQVANSQTRVHGRNITKNKNEAIATSSEAITTFANEAATLAREGNGTGAAESALMAVQTIDDMVEAGNLPTDKAAVMKREINREMTEQASRKRFDDIIKTDGPQAAQDELDAIKGKPKKGWTPDEWDSYTASQQTDINRQFARQKAATQEVSKEAITALNQYEVAKSLGFEVSNDEKNRVHNLVDGTELAPRYNRINKTAAFSVLSANDRTTAINNAQTGELGDVQDYASFIKANNEINKLARKDGYTLGAQQGIIEPVPFDPNSPTSMQERAAQAESLSMHYGVPVSPLTDQEADNLSNQINEMTVQEKINLATTLNEAPATWGQISEKNQPSFAMAGATGDIPFMTAVFKGQELLAAKLVTAPKSSDYLPVLDEFVGKVYGVQDKQAILEAAKNHYAATANDGGEFDAEKFEESLIATTGGIAEVNGYKLELPRGLDEDVFSDFIDEFNPAQVAALGGVTGFTDEEAAEIIQEGRIKSIGENQYIVMADYKQTLFKPDGSPLIISWSEEARAEQEAIRYMKTRKLRDANRMRASTL